MAINLHIQKCDLPSASEFRNVNFAERRLIHICIFAVWYLYKSLYSITDTNISHSMAFHVYSGSIIVCLVVRLFVAHCCNRCSLEFNPTQLVSGWTYATWATWIESLRIDPIRSRELYHKSCITRVASQELYHKSCIIRVVSHKLHLTSCIHVHKQWHGDIMHGQYIYIIYIPRYII